MKRIKIFFVLLTSMILFSCYVMLPPDNVMNVSLYRDHYNPRLEPSKYSDYKGQLVSFDSIEIDAPDVENFYFLSENKTIGYTMFYKSNGMQQPVVSFFWYALQKSFEKVGMVVETGLLINKPQIHIKILYLTDQKAKLQVTLLRNNYLIMQKEMTLDHKFSETKNGSELSAKAYEFIDLIAASILSDSDFKREFFSERGKIKVVDEKDIKQKI